MADILAAARRGDATTLRQKKPQWEHNALRAYVEQAGLLHRLERADRDEVELFLHTYRNSPVSYVPRRKWLKLNARRRNWAAFDAAYVGGLGDDIDCLRAQSYQRAAAPLRPPAYRRLVRRLWLSARSRPHSCDPVFADYYAHGGPGSADVWLRMELALRAHQTKLAHYLRRFAPPENRSWADRWLQMSARPADTLRRVARWPRTKVAENIIAYGMEHLAPRNFRQALARLKEIEARGRFSEDHLNRLRQRLFIIAATDFNSFAETVLAQIPPADRDPNTREWAVRVALHHQDWPRVEQRIAELGVDLREQDVWRFWTAYAHRAQGKRDLAGHLFRELAHQATYYGFLAADQLGYAYAICPQGVPTDPLVRARVAALPGLQRALALYRLGRNTPARREWWAMSQQLSSEELAQAAILADAAGWHYSTVLAFADVGLWRDYHRRFPIEYDPLVTRYASHNGLSPAFVYAVIRAESAFQPDARSSAGAVGLMQLSPGSARALAKRFPSLVYRHRRDLLRPERNIALGTRYMADLMRRFGNDYWAAVAAYNAGPNVARRWRKTTRKQPPELVIETLPYRETRDYVKRIFAFAVVYDWRLGRPLKTLSSRMSKAQARPVVGAHCPVTRVADYAPLGNATMAASGGSRVKAKD